MFERYTEKARRTIFFARYEASILGGDTIETEHLLLGLLREDKKLARLLKWPEAIRKEIEARMTVQKKTATSIELPVSQHCKSVLQRATSEADSLNHKAVDTGHIVLGILRCGDSLAKRLLEQHGLDYEKAQAYAKSSPAEYVRYQLRSTGVPPVADIPPQRGALWASGYLRKAEAEWGKFCWQKVEPGARDALRERTTGKVFLHTHQAYDAERFDLLPGGWTHDRCVICWRELIQPPCRAAYTNGQDWLCEACYRAFVDPGHMAGAGSE